MTWRGDGGGGYVPEHNKKVPSSSGSPRVVAHLKWQSDKVPPFMDGSTPAGRLMCDTYLSARELVKSVDFTLGTLAQVGGVFCAGGYIHDYRICEGRAAPKKVFGDDLGPEPRGDRPA